MTLFFVVNILSLLIGVFGVLSIVFIDPEDGDGGTKSLLLPMVPLAFLTLLQIIHYYLTPLQHGLGTTGFWTLAYESGRILIGIAWIIIAYYHYALNNLDILRRGKLYFFTVLSLALWLHTVFSVWLPTSVPPETINNYVVVLMLYFAGFKALLALKKGRPLLKSTRTSIYVALISLAIYPGVAIGDILGWSIPFLDSNIPIWIQVHPFYYTAMNIPLIIYVVGLIRFRHNEINKEMENDEVTLISSRFMLTPRETEILRLVFRGYRNQMIADQTYVSLATVKTHIHHIFRKTDVGSRGELFHVARSIRD